MKRRVWPVNARVLRNRKKNRKNVQKKHESGVKFQSYPQIGAVYWRRETGLEVVSYLVESTN